jgi:hypothetical protein
MGLATEIVDTSGSVSHVLCLWAFRFVDTGIGRRVSLVSRHERLQRMWCDMKLPWSRFLTCGILHGSLLAMQCNYFVTACLRCRRLFDNSEYVAMPRSVHKTHIDIE